MSSVRLMELHLLTRSSLYPFNSIDIIFRDKHRIKKGTLKAMFARLHTGIWLKQKANCFFVQYFTHCAFVHYYIFSPSAFFHIFLKRHFQLPFPLSLVCFFSLCLLLPHFPLSSWKLSLGFSFFSCLISLLFPGSFCKAQWSALSSLFQVYP